MRMVGPALFAQAELSQALQAQFGRVARDAVYEVCVETSRVSKLRLKRAISKAAQFLGSIEVGAPMPITTRQVTAYGNVEAECLVPFSGDPQLLLLSAPGWPRTRGVRGRAAGNMLCLEAQAGRAFVPWLPALFTAELEAIGRHLHAQADVVRRYHADLEPRVQLLVDRIFPNLDPAALRQLTQQTLTDTVVLEQMRQKAWAKLLDPAPVADPGNIQTG